MLHTSHTVALITLSPYKPHYLSCPSVRLSGRLSVCQSIPNGLLLTQEKKRHKKKIKINVNVSRAGATAVPNFRKVIE